jgi:ceramide glucosyltransferase
MARHDLWVVSDADVRVPPDFLAHAVLPFRDADVGLVNPFYSLANPTTLAMRWEAVAVNADFWSSVLQARLLGPIDFALGAAMAVRRSHVERMGGFLALARHLADDFELGHRVALQGGRVVLCPVVVDCWDAPRSWAAVWRHQVRWARTIRVCRPGPYGWSLLSNATLWPLLALIALPRAETALAAGCCLVVRLLTAADNQRRLTRSWRHGPWLWLAPVKDLLQVALWALAFLGHRVEWRGQHFRVSPSGELEPVTPNQA